MPLPDVVSGLLLSERPWVRIPPGTPRRNGLRSIQKAQPFGWAFLIPLRHSSFSPQNFALQTFVGAPLYGPGRERASISSRKLTAEQGQSLAPLFLCHKSIRQRVFIPACAPHSHPLSSVTQQKASRYYFLPLPLIEFLIQLKTPLIAQLAGALCSDPEGRWFESSRAHHKKTAVFSHSGLFV